MLKLSRNKKDLNDVTAAPFLVFFLLLAVEKKTPKTGQPWRFSGPFYFMTTLVAKDVAAAKEKAFNTCDF